MGIGKRVREAREHLGLTQKELGEIIGVTASAITNYENETSHPKEPVMYSLLRALKVDANYLFQDEMAETSEMSSAKIIPMKIVKLDYENLGKLLAAARKEGRYSCEKIASLMNVTPQTIIAWEDCSAAISIPEQLKMLCAAYNLDYQDTLNSVSEKTPDFNNQDYITKEEFNMLMDFRNLDPAGQEDVLYTIKRELPRSKQRQEVNAQLLKTVAAERNKEHAETVRVFQAAYTDDRSIPAGYTEIAKERLDKIKAAPTAKNKDL